MRPNRLLASLAAVASTAAFAQSVGLVLPPGPREVSFPPTSAALVDDAAALRLNPAALTSLGGLEAFYAHEVRSSPVAGAPAGGANALYLTSALPGLGYGGGVEWSYGAGITGARRIRWGAAFGSDAFSLGASLTSYQARQDPALDGAWMIDVGLLSRPARYVSFGLVGRNLNAREAVPLERTIEAAVGLRPFDDRFTVGVDYRFGELGPLGGAIGYTAAAELWRGVQVSAGASHRLRDLGEVAFQVGVRVDFEHVGFWAGGGRGPHGVAGTAAVRMSSQRYPSVLGGRRVALIDLADRLRTGRSTLGTLLGLDAEDPFIRTVRLLEQAERDAQLAGIVLKIDLLPDTRLGKVTELRDAVLRLRGQGKRVVAVVMNANDAEYLLASAADEVYAVPQAMLAVNGLVAQTTYLGGTMDKLAVHWDVARVGAYKTAPEALTRYQMSDAQRESLEALLQTQLATLEEGVGKARRISPEALRAILAEGLLSPARAQKAGLVDEVISTQALEKRIDERFAGASFDARYAPGAVKQPRWGGRRRIAIVPVLGNIDGGKSRQTPLGNELIAGAETVVRALRRAADDPDVVAIVLRIDSPGGGVLASDLMYRAALAAKEKKPLVASMGDVAASGGYYVAMAADEVLASPTTITGSIGVFMVKPALQGLFGKLGATQESVTTAGAPEILSTYRPWTEAEAALAQRWVDDTYRDFIGLVAERRKLDVSEVDAVARGRVWSGADAKERKLVDGFGGLAEALAAARRRAEIPADEPLELAVYGEGRSFLAGPGGEEGVLARLLGIAVPARELPPALRELAKALEAQAAVYGSGGVQARMEYELEVE